ncbi:MAG: methyltransferase domain-containing protein [Candidatus Omnitrophica bacterium]|nr:methyltransferase domain-containing protein [Candidatus Omnitrophota bacterium]MDD5310561.1 methyltransferase domain-containing protein [Candidatus Omnitrophota bacterium]MDD5546013.1 methyltransferase domain-containing protein [Candidatus Omnitrophota bacterium]
MYKKDQGLRDGQKRDIRICDECGTLYPYPRADGNECGEYLSRAGETGADICCADPRKQRPDLAAVLIGKTVRDKGAALDIGTFTGGFCHVLEGLGFDAYGLEPQEKAAECAREQGLKVYTGSFPDDIPGELMRRKYSLISVLESCYYFTDLRESLEKINGMLEKDGFLAIKCHQGKSRYYNKYSCFERYGDYVQGIPTADSLRYCLGKTGFRVVKVMGINSADLLPYGLGLIPALTGFVSRIYNWLFLRLTSLDIRKADRLVIIARKAGQ